jgi:hypothetical protein
MPTKNETTIEWGSGTLYFYPPEGGDPVAVGPVKDLTETREEEWQDDLGLPIPLNTSITQTVTFEAELEALSLPKLWLLTGDVSLLVKWSQQHHPRLFHLAGYAKTARRRAKNIRRLTRLFMKEAQNG